MSTVLFSLKRASIDGLNAVGTIAQGAAAVAQAAPVSIVSGMNALASVARVAEGHAKSFEVTQLKTLEFETEIDLAIAEQTALTDGAEKLAALKARQTNHAIMECYQELADLLKDPARRVKLVA